MCTVIVRYVAKSLITNETDSLIVVFIGFDEKALGRHFRTLYFQKSMSSFCNLVDQK